MSASLSDVERRLLGHLPAWRADEDAKKAGDDEIKAGGLTIASYTAAELTGRLGEDRLGDTHFFRRALAERAADQGDGQIPTLDERLVAAELSALAERGLAQSDGEGNWTMTREGLEALTA